MVREIFKKIKMFLWNIGIWRSCPLCGGELEKTGHAKEDGWQKYRCTNRYCDFGDPIKKEKKDNPTV